MSDKLQDAINAFGQSLNPTPKLAPTPAPSSSLLGEGPTRKVLTDMVAEFNAFEPASDVTDPQFRAGVNMMRRHLTQWVEMALLEMPAVNGAELIAAERRRQITQEEYSLEHDKVYTRNELPRAAKAYMLYNEFEHFLSGVYGLSYEAAWWQWQDYVKNTLGWPWEVQYFVKPEYEQPKDRVRNLVKAGALIAAEIDRLQAADQTVKGGQPNA